MSGTVTTGINPAIALQAGQGVTAPQNPLTTFGQFAGIQNALTQNRALEAGIAQTQQSTQGMAQQQALQRLGLLGQHVNSLLLESPDGVPARALAASTAQALTMGLLKRDEVGQVLSQIPMGDSPEEMAERTRMLRQFAAQGLGIAEQTGRVRGNLTMLSNGQSVQPAYVGEGAPRLVGEPIDQYPDRGSLNNRVIVGYDPITKAPIYGPQAAVTPPSLGGPAVGGPGGFKGAPSPLGTGRIPAALRNPAAGGGAGALPASGVAGTPATSPTTSMPAAGAVTGIVAGAPGPADVAAASTTGTGSATAFQQIADLASGAPDRRAGLQNMLADTSQFVTGPGQEGIKTAQAVFQRLAPSVSAALGITPESIAANESFDKIAARIASQQGAGSDARLGVAQAANPSSKLTPKGVDLILRQLIGNEDYIQARAKLAATYPNQTDRAGFETKIGANLDPRVFQFSRMTGDQRKTFFDSLKDKGAFKKAYGWAEGQGLLSGP